MSPIGAIAVLLPLLAAAAPVAAQNALGPPHDRFGALARPLLDAPLAPGRDGISFRIVEQVEPDGSWKLGRGIIAGFEVAPDALVGVGLFETLPKRVVRSDEKPLDAKPKRSRKAAVGLTLKF